MAGKTIMAPKTLQDLNYDVLLQICKDVSQNSLDAQVKLLATRHYSEPPLSPPDLKNLSLASKHLRDVVAPLLFETVTINGDWYVTAVQLIQMKKGFEFLTSIKCCKLSPPVGSTHNHQYRVSPPTDLPGLLIHVLNRMDHLGKLAFSVPESDASLFALAFKDKMFPQIENLVVARRCEFIISSCPNVKCVSQTGNDYWVERNYNLVKAAGQAPNLTHFVMQDSGLLHLALEYMPALTHFTLGYCNFTDDLEQAVRFLSQFANLQYLATAEIYGQYQVMCGGVIWDMDAVSKLRSIYFPFQYSHTPRRTPAGLKKALLTPYFGQAKRQQERRKARSEERAAQIVLPVCKHLKILCLGDTTKVEAVRAENGDIQELKWSPGCRDMAEEETSEEESSGEEMEEESF